MNSVVLALMLAQIGPPQEDVSEALDRLAHRHVQTRDAATRRLASWGPVIRGELEPFSRDPYRDFDARWRARLLLRYFDLIEAAPPMFRGERRSALAPLVLRDWNAAWRDLTTLVYEEGLQAGGSPSESLTRQRAVQIEWYLKRMLNSDAPAALKARAAVGLSRLGRADAVAPHATQIFGWIPDATDAEIELLRQLMRSFGQDTRSPAMLWQLREHPRLLLQVNAAARIRRRPETRGVLIDLLHYPRAGTRDAAAYLLAQGEVYEAAPDIADIFRRMAPEASAQLIATAAALNVVEAIPSMLQIFREGRRTYADDVGAALIELDATDSTDELIAMLKTSAPGVAIEIIRVLKIIGAPEAGEAIAPLAIKGSNPLRLSAVQALRVIDSERYRKVIEAGLADLISDGYAPAIRYQSRQDHIAAASNTPPKPPPPPARGVHSDAGPEWEIPRARLWLGNPKPGLRREAIRILERHAAYEAAGDLSRLLRDPDPAVRILTVRALGLLGPEQVVDASRALLRDRTVEVRRETVLVLSGSLDGIPGLQHAMHDSEFEVRLAAAEGLAAFGRKQGIAALEQLLQDPSGRRWTAAAEALARLDRHECIPLLLKKLDETRSRWSPTLNAARPALVHAAAQLMQPGDGGRLIPYLDDPDLDVRQAAVEEICRLGGDGVVGPVARFLAHRHTALREAAALGLQRLPAEATVMAAAPLLEDPRPFVREAATTAIGAGDDPLSIHLVLGMQKDPSARVHRAARKALAADP